MIVVAFGGRTHLSYDQFCYAMDHSPFKGDITKIISSGSNGVESTAYYWAKNNKIKFEEFVPDQKRYKNDCWNQANKEMAKVADAGFALWRGINDDDTKEMITLLEKLNKPVFQYIDTICFEKETATFIMPKDFKVEIPEYVPSSSKNGIEQFFE